MRGAGQHGGRARASRVLSSWERWPRPVAPGHREAAQEGPAVPDPMTTNIPYVASAGTQARMVKCSSELEGLPRKGLTALVESWSGKPNLRPQIIDNSLDFVRHGGERCARFNVVTLGDGLARIKLKAFDDARDEILEHQFLGIWLRLGTPAIDEVGATDPTGGPVGSHTEVGDPAGDGAFLPSSKNGRVQVKVTGTFPDANGATRTLPNDWAALASELASDPDPTDTNPAARWDIHDDSLQDRGPRGRLLCSAGRDGDRRGGQLPRRRRQVLARVRRLRS